MSPTLNIISPPTELGEGPHWDESTQSLYYVDIWNSSIHRYVPETNQHTTAKIHVPGQEVKPVSIIIPVKDEKNKFVITYGPEVYRITWDGINDAKDYELLAVATEDDRSITRINDGKCSPSGVLFAGSMAMDESRIDEKVGNLYSFKELNPKRLLKDISISNGLAWTSDEKTVYYVDSSTRQVEGFDYDAKTTEFSNRRTIFNLLENDINAFPDGMAIDTDGNLWLACYLASRVVKIDPKTGKLLDTISFPTPNITSVAFGGKNLDELYVTSAQNQRFMKNLKEGDTAAGCTFKVTGVGAKGIAGVPIDLNVSKN